MFIDTIAAIATPIALGGVSIIRISGNRSIEIAQQVFQSFSGKSLLDMQGYTACYGGFYNTEKEQLDTGIALVFRAPKSMTGETVVELSCHGGIFITKEILRLVIHHGARMAQAGEFSKRAFLNGKMSLTQTEAVMDLIHSQNLQALKSAKSQMDGALFQEIEQVKQTLLTVAGHLAAWVDYPEEEIEAVEQDSLLNHLTTARKRIQKLLSTFDRGRLLREGVETAIVGKPNVGKSTLMNLLSGCEKSIVTEIAGTTRDVVEEAVNLGNVILRLADTAGIRETEDVVERYGVELALKRMQTAELVLAVFDYSSELTEEDHRIIEVIRQQNFPVIAVINKTDLVSKLEEPYLKQYFSHIVYTSVENQDSLQLLSEKIEEVLNLVHLDTSSAILANERQRSCARKAEAALQETIDALQSGITLDAVAVSVETAISALLELTGERVTDAVVDQVFHNFCVGK